MQKDVLQHSAVPLSTVQTSSPNTL